MTLTVPAHGRPEISVVMVTHGAWSLTEQAIGALVENTAEPFELIVVDNASRDQTRDRLSELGAVRTILNERNRGFGPAVNQGAAQACGRHLVLLNSDAFVHPGWLEPLLDALASDGAGAAVPRYVNREGTLQEAGALLARDGTVNLYGEGDEPERPCYRFRRTIDYGSAVCMLIPRATFAALGGFDERYAPAYYEDSDLCMRLAEHETSVVYEPRSTVTHVRYGSGGLDQAVELSARNRKTFVERWGSRLAGRPASFVNGSDQGVILARDALARPRLLLCAHPAHDSVESLAGALLDGWPHGRLTWMTGTHPAEGFESERWLARGVEVLDHQDASWLSDRLFHYDVVLSANTASDETPARVARTQPQAVHVGLDELAGPPEQLLPRLVRLLANAGVA